MRKSLSIVFASGLVASLVACGSGSVGTYSYEQAYEGHPGDFTPPSESNQQRPRNGQQASNPPRTSSGSSVDVAPSAGSSGSSGSTNSKPVLDAGSSGTSGTTKGACSVCGATYSCQGFVSGQAGEPPLQQTFTIGPASNNTCAIAERGTASLTCDGRVTSLDGSVSGSWTASSGELLVTLDESGTTTTYDCTKQ
ncbi:hypothetical protein AKJ09_03469 [Labilithrix luteola]|uniref:Ig-like domain-containing protein n=1 Tax=Labilithrix luteola TaxID=1391654 RepID=A0A0K1PTF3_9BACT|nr:hypothetical protein [Labilithrix luteola]AKU96805.1 hypothetical protein AKJ09_03469 [Labilithrix luteola]